MENHQIDHDFNGFLWNAFDFILRNLFGILSTLVGFAYQIYQMSGRTRRMTKWQCISSVFMWLIASIAIVIGLEDANINKLFYGFICWLTPIVVKPIADTASIRISPLTDKVFNSLEKLIDSYTKKADRKKEF